MPADYTKLAVGAVLPNGRRIEKCPVCGRNGLVIDLGHSVSTTHVEWDEWITASGEPRGKRGGKNANCLARKPSPTDG